MYLCGLSIPPDHVDGHLVDSAYGTYVMSGSVRFIEAMNDAIGHYFGLIMGFYFAGGMIEGSIRSFAQGKAAK